MYNFDRELATVREIVTKTGRSIRAVLDKADRNMATGRPLNDLGELQGTGPLYDVAVSRYTALTEIAKEIQTGREDAVKALKDDSGTNVSDETILGWIAEDLDNDREHPFRPRSLGWRQFLLVELDRRRCSYALRPAGTTTDEAAEGRRDAHRRLMRDGGVRNEEIAGWIAEKLNTEREITPRSAAYLSVLRRALAERGGVLRVQAAVDHGTDNIDDVIRRMRDGE